jgi:hypothetical protein
MLRKAEVAVPSGNQNHVVSQVLPLNLQLLHNDNIGLQNIKHGIEGALFAPWLVAKWVADAIHIPSGDTDHDATEESWYGALNASSPAEQLQRRPGRDQQVHTRPSEVWGLRVITFPCLPNGPNSPSPPAASCCDAQAQFRPHPIHSIFDNPTTTPDCDPLHSIPSADTAMFATRALMRSRAQLGLARAPIRRRMYSSETPKQFAGAEDNEFNRERARIAEHAAESGGELYSIFACGCGYLVWLEHVLILPAEFWFKLSV